LTQERVGERFRNREASALQPTPLAVGVQLKEPVRSNVVDRKVNRAEAETKAGHEGAAPISDIRRQRIA
jgi:hypothetical protein